MMNNKPDTTYYPNMKTAVSSFRFERTTLKKRLDKYQEQHTKTLREIRQNQKDLTRSLSLDSEQSLDKHKLHGRRRTRSFYGSEHGISNNAGEHDDDHHSFTGHVLSYNIHDRRRRSGDMTYPAFRNQTNGKLNASSFLQTKPRSASFLTNRSSSGSTSSSLAESKTTKRVLTRQERIEKNQESEIQKSLIEQTENMIISDQERSILSSKVNIDAFKNQKHDKHKMNLTEKSQQITSKRSVNSSDHQVKTIEQKDKEKSNLFKNKNPLPTVSKQNANSSRESEPKDNHPIKSVNDITRTILVPASVQIKQPLRSTKSLSPIGTRKAAIRERSQTFAGETENQGNFSENLHMRKQVHGETKNANPNQQYLQGCHRNAWSERKTLSTSNEISPNVLQVSLTKQIDVKTHLSCCAVGDKTAFNPTEMLDDDILTCSIDDNQRKKITELDQRNETVSQSEDHVTHPTLSANQISEDMLETDCCSLNGQETFNSTARHPTSGSGDNHDTRDKKTATLQSQGWRNLRALPLKRTQEIGERNLPVLQDFPVRDSTLPGKPGLMSFKQVVLAAIKKQDDEQTKKKKTGEILISKERLNEIQQPTESFLRQTLDKKRKYYTTHAPRPPTEDRPRRGPEFHAVAKGIQGFQTLSSVVNANRLLRAEKIRKKASSPYTRTQDFMTNGHKTMSEMMEEVKNCRYLKNKEKAT